MSLDDREWYREDAKRRSQMPDVGASSAQQHSSRRSRVLFVATKAAKPSRKGLGMWLAIGALLTQRALSIDSHNIYYVK